MTLNPLKGKPRPIKLFSGTSLVAQVINNMPAHAGDTGSLRSKATKLFDCLQLKRYLTWESLVGCCPLVLKFHLLWSQCADWVRQDRCLFLLRHPCRTLSVHHTVGSTMCLILLSCRWANRASRIIQEAWIRSHAFFLKLRQNDHETNVTFQKRRKFHQAPNFAWDFPLQSWL